MSHGDTPDDDGVIGSLTRRDFGKAVGATSLLGAAMNPAEAAEQRDTGIVQNTDNTLSGSFTPRNWMIAGPFQYQRREGDVDSLAAQGGVDDYGTGESRPDEGQLFQSVITGGGSITWESIDVTSGNTVPLNLADRIDPTDGELMPLTGASGLFDDLQDWFGLGAVLYGTGYAVTTVRLREPTRAVLESSGTVWVNGHRYDESPTAVVLQEGVNYIAARSTLTLGAGSLSIEFRPPEAPVEVNAPAAFRGTPQNGVLPDLREGETIDEPAGFRVTNTTGEPQSGTLELAAPDGLPVADQTVDIDPPLAPFETRRINTRITQTGSVSLDELETTSALENSEVSTLGMASTQMGDAFGPDADEDSPVVSATDEDRVVEPMEVQQSTLTVSASVADTTDTQEYPLRIRSSDEKRRQATFTSRHDDSVQCFSYTEPTNVDADSGPWELVVALHGANVPSINQAGAYTQREDTYVLAPAARGPVNYDHEDLGRLDDLEALDVFREQFDIDESSIYLTGHSMGGHGTWHIGMTNSDRFAGIAPSAAWTDHETYIHVLFSRDKLWTHPQLKSLKEMSLYKNLALPKLENAQDGSLPVYALQGGADPTVPSMHPRMYLRGLANLGLDVEGQVGKRFDTSPDEHDAAYLEVPGQGHWWDASIGEGNDSVNHPDMIDYITSASNDLTPEHVHFYTTNLQVENKKYWVGVELQQTAYESTRVDATATSQGLEVSTENVANLIVDVSICDAHGVPAELHVGDSSLSLPSSSPSGHAERAPDFDEPVIVNLEGGLSIADAPGQPAKTPETYGPLKQIHYKPYYLVYGTQGDAETTALNRNMANIRSQRLVTRARAPATVVADTELTDAMAAESNLVLFGTPSSNSVLADMQSDMPLTISEGSVTVGDTTYEGEYAVEYIYPNPENSDQLVQVSSGTTVDAAHLTTRMDWTPTQSASLDYAVFDESLRYQRWNACVAGGFFDPHWEIDRETGFLADQNLL